MIKLTYGHARLFLFVLFPKTTEKHTHFPSSFYYTRANMVCVVHDDEKEALVAIIVIIVVVVIIIRTRTSVLSKKKNK